MLRAAASPQRRIPFYSAWAGRPAYLPPAPASHAAQGTYRPTSAAPPTPGQLCGFYPLVFKEAAARGARVSASPPLRGLRVRVAAPRSPVMTAVMTAMVTVVTAHGRAAAAHVRRRVVGVLREDGARAEDERQDERAREYKLLHSFSGSPLKESDRSCGVVSVRLAVCERPRAATPFSTLDRRRSQRPCQRARRDRRSVFASFCSRRTRRTRAPLWRLCAPLQNRHTFDCGIRIADCGLKRGCGLKTAWLSCSFNPKSAAPQSSSDGRDGDDGDASSVG